MCGAAAGIIIFACGVWQTVTYGLDELSRSTDRNTVKSLNTFRKLPSCPTFVNANTASPLPVGRHDANPAPKYKFQLGNT